MSNIDLKNPEFSCYWWDREGYRCEEKRGWPFLDCLQAAKRLAQGPASVLGIVHRVIITDGGDHIVFEWKIDEGVTFPTQAEQTP